MPSFVISKTLGFFFFFNQFSYWTSYKCNSLKTLYNGNFLYIEPLSFSIRPLYHKNSTTKNIYIFFRAIPNMHYILL